MDEYVYKFKILMVSANLTLQGGQPWSTLFYSLSLGYSIPYLFSCGEVESAKHLRGRDLTLHSLFSLLNTMFLDFQLQFHR